MAEITQDAGKDVGGGKVRAKKRSTRVDMTPMVDLAFLLLTFFILTSALNKPHVMELNMPDDDLRFRPPWNERNILNLAPADKDKIHWWIGVSAPVETTDFSPKGLRKILLEKKVNPDLMVLIKPTDDARFENLVDILDEISITGLKRFAIVDFSEDDRVVVNNK